MKNKFIMVACGLALAVASQGQQRCLTDEIYRQQVLQNPELKEREAAFNQAAKATPAAKKAGKRIIPVVFHVFHVNGAENITKAQIEDQIRILNLDYARLNADTVNTDTTFRSLAANMNVEFRLARLDPNGNCTDGIVRYYTPYTENADDGIKHLSVWPGTKYLNIWVVKNIKDQGQQGTILGYAQFPWAGSNITDGVLIRADYIGTIGTSSPAKAGRTATHEVGHWLGLYHPFQDGCTGGDKVEDTPPVADASFGCSPRNSCHNDNPDLPDMYQNFMDYADGNCQNLFTLGQLDRVNATIWNSRQTLTSEENLIATGTDQPTTTAACAPVAGFNALSSVQYCAGATVVFRDYSYNGAPTSWEWSFPGGTPATSTAQNPSVTYDNPGKYDVTLTVTNAKGTSTSTRTQYVDVRDLVGGVKDGFFEGVENSGGLMPAGWELVSTNGTNQWITTGDASYDGYFSFKVNNDFNLQGNMLSLISPSYDLSTINHTPYFNFYYSFVQRLNNLGQKTADRLTIAVSTDCGKTWTNRWSQAGNALNVLPNAAVPTFTVPYVPSERSKWKGVNVSLSGYNKPNVRIKIDFTSDGGHNMFLDNINLGYALSSPTVDADALGVTVYPNPTSGPFTMSYNLDEHAEEVEIVVYDVYGREVKVIRAGEQMPGTHTLEIDNFSDVSGIYYVRVTVRGKGKNRFVVKKIIVDPKGE